MAGEDDLDVVGSAEVEVVGDQRLEERPGVAGHVEDQGAGGLDLPHRQLPPVARGPVGVGQRQRQDRHPPVEEPLDPLRPELVADRLQPGGVGAGGEPVGQLGEPDPGVDGLALGPLMAVDPHLDRVGEVGADLDERRTEVVVPQVEVEVGDPTVGLGEGEPHRLAVAVLGRGEHPLILLRHTDRGDPGAAGRSLRGHVRTHHLDLPVVLTEPHHRNVLGVGQLADPTPERGADPLQIAGEGIGNPRCRVMNSATCPPTCSFGT